MSFIRDVVDQTLRALGTQAQAEQISRLEQSVMLSLRRAYGGDTVRVYVPKVGSALRADRARQIRSLWDGRNTTFLAQKYGLTDRQIQRIVRRGATHSD